MYTKDLEERILFLFAIVTDLENNIPLEKAFFNYKNMVDKKILEEFHKKFTEKEIKEMKELMGIDPTKKEIPVYHGNLDYAVMEQGFKEKLPFYAILAKQGFDNYIVNLIIVGEEHDILSKSIRYAIDTLSYQRREYLLEEAKIYDTLAELVHKEVPILDALKQASSCSTNITLKNAFSQIIRDTEKGDTISDSMSNNEDIFDPYTIKLIQEFENPGSSEHLEPQDLNMHDVSEGMRKSARVLRRLAQYKRRRIMDSETEL